MGLNQMIMDRLIEFDQDCSHMPKELGDKVKAAYEQARKDGNEIIESIIIAMKNDPEYPGYGYEEKIKDDHHGLCS